MSGARELLRIPGLVQYRLVDEDGRVRSEGELRNLITRVGDQFYGERAAGIASPPAQITGAKLGTGSTAAAKTSTGAALITYLTNSHLAVDGGFPTSSLSGSSRRIQYRFTFAPGKATSASAIREAVLVNDTLADATSPEANTIARFVFGATDIPNKNAGDTLTLTWNHDLLGA